MQILTAQELHNLAMNIVGEKLEKMGYPTLRCFGFEESSVN